LYKLQLAFLTHKKHSKLKFLIPAHFFWLIIFIFAVAHKGQCENSSESWNDINGIQVSDFQFYIDDSGKEDFKSIQNKAFDVDSETAFKKIVAYNRKRNIWVKLYIKNTLPSPDSMSIRYPFVSEMVVYAVQNGTITEHKKGYRFAELNHKTNNERWYSTFQLPPNSETEIWICINNYTRFMVSEIDPMEVLSPDKASLQLQKFIELEDFTRYFSFAFISFLLFQMFYVSLQWFLAKRLEYGYYLTFISITFLYFALRFFIQSPFAHSFEYVIVMSAYLNDFLLLLPPFFYFLFGRHFLDLKNTNPKLNKLIKNMGNIMLIVVFLVPAVNYLVPNDLPKTAITMSAVGFQFILALIALYNVYFLKTTLSRFLLVGSSFAFLGHIFALLAPFVLPMSNVVSASPIHLTMVGILLEIGVFNSGLLFKARQVELARVIAQQGLIEQLESRQRLQAEYSSVREKISSDLHDDLGSNLSSIGVFSYAARKKLELNEQQETEKLILQIEQRARESLQSLSDLVWSVNPINDNNEKLIKRIISFIQSLTQARGIVFKTSIDTDFYLRSIDQLEKRNIQLLIKEAINNIIKHAHAQAISLTIEKCKNSFCIVITDDGVGFDITMPRDSNGLRGMKKRMEEINGSLTVSSKPGHTQLCFELAEKPFEKAV